MIQVTYLRANTAADAVRLSEEAGHRLLGGGINFVDLMREGVGRPAVLVAISRLSIEIEEAADGSVLIGAGARNSAVAAHPLVRTRYPMLARAILAGASAQIRNMATVGGNLLQRTLIMQDDQVHYNGQVVAAVVAETQEQANRAATLIAVDYEAAPAQTRFEDAKPDARVIPSLLIERNHLSFGRAEREVSRAPHEVDNLTERSGRTTMRSSCMR